MSAFRLELLAVTKRYPTVVANDEVSLSVQPGEIHAVLGENGAGKSTLMKVIYGAVQADSGEMFWEGRPVRVPNPASARALGIGMVYQHFSLFETLTVAENISLVAQGRFDLESLGQRIVEVSNRYGLPIDPRRSVHSLSVGERQRVEIVRCLLQEPKLLIMDEPTSVLTPQAVQRLFETLRQLASEGVSILYISHKLDEIRSLCHSATVMRGGRVTGLCDPRQCSSKELAQMMIGRELPHPEPRRHHPGEVLLKVNQLDWKTTDPFGTSLSQLSFDLKAGEILGVAGISGNGQQELLAVLSGEQTVAASSIQLCERDVGDWDAGRRRDIGMGFVPEERLGRGAVPALSLAENSILTGHRRGLVEHGFLQQRASEVFASSVIERFGVKAGGVQAAAQSLSGGNLQKFIVGRELNQRPKVLIVAQPTWGVDVGAAALIRQSLVDLASTGVAVLVISEELDELFEIADRIMVLAQGRLSRPKHVTQTTSDEIGLLMAGLNNQAESEPSAAQAGGLH